MMTRRSQIIWCGMLVWFALLLLTPEITAQKRRQRKPTPPPPAKISQEELKQLATAASQSREHLIKASQVYQESLSRLLELQKQDETRAAELVEKRKQLLELGLLAPREVAASEQELVVAREKSAETRKQIDQAQQLIAEVEAAEELARRPPAAPSTTHTTKLLIRYAGTSRWSLSDLGTVDVFFRLKFGRPLPVSAFGQTATHNHLGFDHREAMDVAVHPDSEEGQALINFLRGRGISFIAIRGAITGSATGAHIHIGPPSKRILLRP
jgi:hypothetical protein